MLNNIYNNTTIPPYTPGMLARPALQNLLAQAAEHPLVTVVAGAGYGKTQAVSSFAASLPGRVAWLQLTRLDNYTDRFWGGFTHALSAACPELSSRLEQLGFPDSGAKFDQFLTLLAPQVYSCGRFVVVLDDFHLIEEEAIRFFVENLIAARLENFCLILISRVQPRLRPGCLTGQNWLGRISGEELCFSESETEEYLRLQGVKLPLAQLRQIYETTGGWPLALYLLSLSLKKGASPPGDPLRGALPLIFDLIERELFAEYSPPVQEFLIQLSLLETFPLALLPQLTAIGSELIAELMQTNMFIHYDPHTQHYHFHPLFAEFLRSRQHCLPLEQRQQFYHKAGDWHLAQGLFIDAVTCYKECGNHEKIWQAIKNARPARHPQKTAALLLSLLEELPAEFIAQEPLTRVIRASLRLNNLQLAEASADLLDLTAHYQALPQNAQTRALLGEAYLVLGLIRLTQRDHSFVHCFKTAHDFLPQGSCRDYGQIKIIDSNSSVILNSLDAEELEKMQASLFTALPYLSQVAHGCGLGAEYLAAAETAYYRGDFAQAEINAFQTLYRAHAKPPVDIICCTYFLLARLYAAQGYHQESANYIRQLRSVANKEKNGFLSMPDIAEGWFYLRVGEPERLAKWLVDGDLNSQIHPPISVGRDLLIRAHWLLTQEQYPELLALLSQLDALYRGKGLWFELVSAMVIKSIALYYLDDPAWLSALEEAYQLAHSCGFIMQFVEMGHHMRAIAKSARKALEQHHIAPEWLDMLHTKSSTYAKRQAFARAQYQQRHQSYPNRDALSKREREILNNLCQGLTREEISLSLNISINTVKSTLQNIYSKLGAINSADAVRIALSKRLL